MSTLLEKALEEVVALLRISRMRLGPRSWRHWPTKMLGRSALPRDAMEALE
jgi:hypothetical protein